MVKILKPAGLNLINKHPIHNGNLSGRAKKRNKPEPTYFTGKIKIKPITKGRCFICNKKIEIKKGTSRKFCVGHMYPSSTGRAIPNYIFTPDEM